jgi:hypothetical protein
LPQQQQQQQRAAHAAAAAAAAAAPHCIQGYIHPAAASLLGCLQGMPLRQLAAATTGRTTSQQHACCQQQLLLPPAAAFLQWGAPAPFSILVFFSKPLLVGSNPFEVLRLVVCLDVISAATAAQLAETAQ